MATLLFAAAGTALGGAIGGTILGVSAASIGGAIGGAIGRSVDASLLTPTQHVTGPRLDNLDVQKSTEGDGLPVVEGRARVAGQVIWATRLEEVTVTTSHGGKGGPQVKTTEFSYYANFAVALTDCTTGPIRHFGRIWADGKPLDTSDLTIRYYHGTDDQTPDPLMVAKDGAAPAYRGTSYVVFERMKVDDFGRRIPNLTFELWGPSGDMEDLIEGVDMIPAATEWGYLPDPANGGSGSFLGVLSGNTSLENARRGSGQSDWSVSLDMLEGVLPNCGTVALVVSWFGTDLRAGYCQFEPRVELADKFTLPDWRVSGLSRADANLVSQIDGKPAFGSTPADESVMGAIQDLKARGFRVVLYPFVMMDIPAGNTLPDREGNTGQPVYPWRGRIGPADADGPVAGQVAALVGTAAPADFPAPGSSTSTHSGVSASLGGGEGQGSVIAWPGAAPPAAPGDTFNITLSTSGEELQVTVDHVQYDPEDEITQWHLVERNVSWSSQTVTVDSNPSNLPTYTGPDEWSYRRFILHLAALARNAGGVDAFLIGTEFPDLTMATDTSGVYPFVDALVGVAADVKTMLPEAAVSYAADWSEYHSHSNGGEVFFHLDPLWSSPNVDFIGIDNYLPLSDWRPGTDHADYDPGQGVTSPYLLDYLKSNIEGGEFWDFFYASQADRDAQVRTPIFDGAHGEDWIFRQKAIRDWHGNAHHNRPGGVREATATAWVPGSKPVWFTEFGCPAIDLGANQPNLFFDPKSSEAALPHYSNGARDDFMQRQHIRAMLEWWGDNGGSIVSPADMLVWTWDARPWPEFPRLTEVWSDGQNWRRGHWLNGRAGNAPAAETIRRRLLSHYGYAPDDFDLTRCFGQADGLILPGPLSFREVLGTWETALRLDASEYGGVFRVASRAAAVAVADYLPEDLVEDGPSDLYTITRTSQEETPRAAVIRYSDTDRDYQRGAARATIRENPGQAEAEAELALVSDLDRMTNVVEVMLRAAADLREGVEFALPPSSTLEPGQVFTLTPVDGRPIRFIADRITRGEARRVKASLYSGTVFGSVGGPGRTTPAIVTPASETAVPYFLDLPLLPGVEMEDHQGLVAFLSEPWPGGVEFYRSSDQETGYGLNLRTGLAATVGETVATLLPGRVGLWSLETLEVRLSSGALVSRPADDVLAGANAMAVEHGPGKWEVLQFRDATLVAADTWHLTGLLRGQLGTEWVRDPGGLPSGARVVLLDAAAIPVEMQAEDIGRLFWWRAMPTGQDPAEAEEIAHTYQGVARRPLSPVHLKADLSGSTLSLTWIRRTRVGGDPWPDTGDVPLGETFERYLVEVGPEGSPATSLEVSDATTAALDVSGLTGTQEVRVAQISETYGPGTPARLTVAL